MRARPEGPQGQRVWSTCSKQQSTIPVNDPQHQTDRRAHRHHRKTGVPGEHTPFSHLHSGPRSGPRQL